MIPVVMGCWAPADRSLLRLYPSPKSIVIFALGV
jgi:hypothetical protein